MRHVRTYPHPIERVWDAVTTAEHLDAWMLPVCKIDLRLGGKCSFSWGGPAETATEATIVAIDPPRLVDYGGLRFELEAVEGGTRLTFIQSFSPDAPRDVFEPSDWTGGDLPAGPGTPWKPGFMAGFHLMLDQLNRYLDGAWTLDDTLAGLRARKYETDPENVRMIELYRRHTATNCPPA